MNEEILKLGIEIKNLQKQTIVLQQEIKQLETTTKQSSIYISENVLKLLK